MLVNQNLLLQGIFNYRIYDEFGNLKKEISGLNNFLTNTGLSFPAIYRFADCFRFLSLGSGTGANTIVGIIKPKLIKRKPIIIPHFNSIVINTMFYKSVIIAYIC